MFNQVNADIYHFHFHGYMMPNRINNYIVRVCLWVIVQSVCLTTQHTRTAQRFNHLIHYWRDQNSLDRFGLTECFVSVYLVWTLFVVVVDSCPNIWVLSVNLLTFLFDDSLNVCVYVVISLSCFPLPLLVCVCMILLTFFVVTSVFNYHPCIYHSWNYYRHNFHCWFLIPPWIFSEIQPSELTSMLQIQMKRLDEQLNDQTNSTDQWPLTIIFILI